MVGRELEFKYSHEHRYHREPRRADVPVLEVKNLSVNDRIGDVNFTVYKKEIVGFFGLVGAGRTEVMRAIFGADRHLGGTIALHGDASRIRNPYAALKRGIGLIPENRREEGVLGNFSIWQNISLPHLQKNSRFQGLVGSTNPKREKTLAQKYRDLLKVKSTSLGQMITELSGGNQQKVVVAKWLASDAEILIFDEPTKGIDVGSKNDIYQIILELAASGKTIIVVSSESEELLSICSRIYVLHEGQIVAEYPIEEATEETLIYSATVEPTGKETGANG
jgi:D-allose transport system ATP-binding protein